MDISLDVDAGLRAEFIDESLEMLSGLEPLFVELEADPTNIDIVQAIFRPGLSHLNSQQFDEEVSIECRLNKFSAYGQLT